MIGTINSFVSKFVGSVSGPVGKVVGTVSAPLYSFGPKPLVKKPRKVSKKGKKAKCSHKGKCKC